MDAGPERYELRQQRRVRARGVLRVLLAERSGGYRFLQALAGPDRFSHSFNQLTQIGQMTAQDRPRSQQPAIRLPVQATRASGTKTTVSPGVLP